MKAPHLLTLSEYKETVSPFIKDFKKFITKNKVFFAKTVGYCGLLHHTLETFIQKEVNNGKKTIEKKGENVTNFDKDFYGVENRTEYAKEIWAEVGGSFEKPSDEILETYNKHINILSSIFGDYISKIESDETNSNKRSIRRAIDNDLYINDMLDGIVTPQEVENILNSVGLKMSKRLKDMKTKVETEGYNRNIVDSITSLKSNLSNQVRKMLEPYTERLKEKKENEITSIVDKFLASDIKDTYMYSKRVSFNYRQANELYTILSNFIDNKTGGKRDTYENLLEITKNNYVESFISKFVARFNEKISVASKSLGEPTIDFGVVRFNGSNLIVNAEVNFKSGDSISCETDVIFAGGIGTMQCLHQRYLMKFTKDGKNISLQQLDRL